MKKIKQYVFGSLLAALVFFTFNGITLATASRNAAADAVVDLVDAGAGAGTLEIQTSGGGTVLAVLTFSDPAFGAASSGVATASSITSDTDADNTGTAAQFQVKDSDANVIFTGTVGVGSGDLQLNTTSITAGGTVSVTSFTYTQPAS